MVCFVNKGLCDKGTILSFFWPRYVDTQHGCAYITLSHFWQHHNSAGHFDKQHIQHELCILYPQGQAICHVAVATRRVGRSSIALDYSLAGVLVSSGAPSFHERDKERPCDAL